MELVHASKWVALNGEDAQRGSRLALANRERLAPAERTLLDAWVRPGYTRPDVIQSWRAATLAYPDRAEVWYWLGDVYYHEGMLAGLAEPFRRASEAFQHGWALDSASGADSSGTESAAIFAEPLSHMVEIAQARGDSATVVRLVRLGLAADSTDTQGWYLRWHRAVAWGLSAEHLFWADSQRIDPEVFARIHRFVAWTGVASEDYSRSARLMLRRQALDDPDGAELGRQVLALNPHPVAADDHDLRLVAGAAGLRQAAAEPDLVRRRGRRDVHHIAGRPRRAAERRAAIDLLGAGRGGEDAGREPAEEAARIRRQLFGRVAEVGEARDARILRDNLHRVVLGLAAAEETARQAGGSGPRKVVGHR